MKMMKKIAAVVLGSAMSFAIVESNAAVFAEGNDGGIPPSPPSSGNDSSGGTPPEMPDGSAPSGNAPDRALGGGGSGSSAVTSWDAATEFSSDTEESDGTYSSAGTDENAVHVSGGSVVLNNPTVTRSSSESSGGDNSSFYGVGAAVLTTGGTSYINGGTITTDADGAAGAFSYGDGVTYIANTVINTSGNTAGGIHVAGGGTLYAYNVMATTQGESSAAIRSDRGGGTMVVDGGTYTSNGTGSPAVYVTADISINDADLVANGSEALCLEGLNTVRLFNSNLTGNMADLDQNGTTWTVILYQSMSGDSEVGEGSFYMVDGTLTSKNGGIFYTTNTDSVFYLENVDITEADDCDYFLRVTGNSNQRGWGTSGANGANATFTANQQEMKGDIIWDSISTLKFYMESGSVLTGAVVDDESDAGSGGSGYADLYIDSSSKWVVTGDSTVTNLYNAGTIVDADGKTVSIVGSDGTVYVSGDSDYTITVSGTYSTEADFSGAVNGVSWTDYAVAAPEQLDVTTTTAEVSTSTAEAETTASAETTTETQDSNSSTGVVIAIVAIVAACAVILMSRRRKSSNSAKNGNNPAAKK
ncbi:hypothetical protein [Galactobacillus timonensis]|uniref:hypothetical protein n=1 Tax=Galactobacillus timonensis TaxID=2041840 RepID=UPI000C8620E4|nr:hypothetical protein [Galactobacillus timonensis]